MLWGGTIVQFTMQVEAGQNSYVLLLVWRPDSIGALNFVYACSPCIVNGNNFFACGYIFWHATKQVLATMHI